MAPCRRMQTGPSGQAWFNPDPLLSLKSVEAFKCLFRLHIYIYICGLPGVEDPSFSLLLSFSSLSCSNFSCVFYLPEFSFVHLRPTSLSLSLLLMVCGKIVAMQTMSAKSVSACVYVHMYVYVYI